MKTFLYQSVTLLLAILLSSTVSLQAETTNKNGDYITVCGVVKNKGNNKRLEYANVAIKGTNIGTVTNENGEFTLKVKNDLQARLVTISHDGERLFEKVLKTSQRWASEDKMMYVVGATQGRAFEDIRRIVPNHFLLVPGVGAQGGSLEEVCQYGMNKQCGLVVNSSRGIIYADNSKDFATFAAEEAHKLQQQMETQLAKNRLL